MVAASRNIDALASSLPEVDVNETAQLARIAALQVRNEGEQGEGEGSMSVWRCCCACIWCVNVCDVYRWNKTSLADDVPFSFLPLSSLYARQAENDEVEKELQEELQKAEVALARVTAAFEGACVLSSLPHHRRACHSLSLSLSLFLSLSLSFLSSFVLTQRRS